MSKANVHGDWVRWLFFAKALCGADVARELSVTRAAVNSWIHGKSEPRQRSRQRLAGLVGVNETQYWRGPSKQLSAVVN